jgi:DNA-binding NarL/FixJ family response regulator
MQPKIFPSPTDRDPEPAGQKQTARKIGLVGRNLFQNKLLKSLLESQLKPACQVGTLTEWHREDSADAHAWDLILWDSYSLDSGDLGVKLRLGDTPDPTEQAVALFNIDPDAGITFERQAIERRIRGVFYKDEPLDRFLKGVDMILEGELWFSRKTTSRILMDAHFRRPTIVAAEAMLTGREKEILNAIASGASNNDIAVECFISPNTVKTHLYNIYKKIGVKNRLEATLWVARYL